MNRALSAVAVTLLLLRPSVALTAQDSNGWVPTGWEISPYIGLFDDVPEFHPGGSSSIFVDPAPEHHGRRACRLQLRLRLVRRLRGRVHAVRHEDPDERHGGLGPGVLQRRRGIQPTPERPASSLRSGRPRSCALEA